MLSCDEMRQPGAVQSSAKAMKRVLLASSSPSLLERNQSLLKRRGVQILTVTTGREALAYHRDYPLDLILADMQLGDMAGDLLCAEVRSRGTGDVPVVLICRDLPGERARVSLSGADDMICRPIVPLKLMETVGRLLELEMVRRKRVDLETEVSVFDKGDGTESSFISRDISVSGIRLEGEGRLTTGSRIACRFTLPCTSRVETDGLVVRRAEPPGPRQQYGVLFLDLPHSSRCQIGSLVAASQSAG